MSGGTYGSPIIKTIKPVETLDVSGLNVCAGSACNAFVEEGFTAP